MSLHQFLSDHQLNNENEIVFFGGSFNPWHEGHSECIRLLDATKPLVVIPDRNPRKDVGANDNLDLEKISYEIKQLKDNVYIYDEFYLLKKKNPTAHWVNDLKSSLPNIELSLLMGFDSFRTLPGWIEAESLLNNLSSLYIASRLEENNEQELIGNKIYNLNKNITIVFLGRHQFEDLSSTQLREDND